MRRHWACELRFVDWLALTSAYSAEPTLVQIPAPSLYRRRVSALYGMRPRRESWSKIAQCSFPDEISR